MENDVIIRYATIADAEKIADLSRKTFHETFGFLNAKENMDKFMALQFSREMLIEEVNKNENTFIVAEKEMGLVGYAKLCAGKPEVGLSGKLSMEISRIYALNSYLGTGVGPALMRKCIFAAKEMKCDNVWLGVWEKNPRAIAFYIKWGFEKFGEHPFQLGNDVQTDWLMKKELN